jgi:hypothetical protein
MPSIHHQIFMENGAQHLDPTLQKLAILKIAQN